MMDKIERNGFFLDIKAIKLLYCLLYKYNKHIIIQSNLDKREWKGDYTGPSPI